MNSFLKIGKVIGYFFLFLGLLVACLLAIGQTPYVKEKASQYIGEEFRKATGYEIEAQGVEGFLPFTFSAKELRISKNSESLVDVHSLQMLFSPLHLLQGKITFTYRAETSSPLLSSFLDQAMNISGAVEFDLLTRHLIQQVTLENVNTPFAAITTTFTYQIVEKNQFAFWLQIQELQNHSRLQISGDLHLLDNGHLTFPDLKGQLFLYRARKSFAQFEGKLVLQSLYTIKESQLQVHIPNLRPLSQLLTIPTEGSLEGIYEVTGTIFEPVIKGKINSSVIQIGAHRIVDTIVDTFLQIEKGSIKGKGTLQSRVNQIPIFANAELQWEGKDALHLSKMELILPKTKLKGDVQYFLTQKTLSGVFEGKVEDLIPFSSLAQTPLHGSLNVRAVFSSEQDKQNRAQQKLHLFLKGSRLSFDSWLIEDIQIETALTKLLGHMRGPVSLRIENAAKNEVKVKNIHWKTEIDLERSSWPFTLSAIGGLSTSAEMNSSGSWRIENHGFNLALESWKGHYSIYPFSLDKPTSVRIDPEKIEISPLEMSIGKGKLQAFVNYRKSGRVEAKLRANDIALQIVSSHFLPDVPLDGTATILASLSGSSENVQGRVEGSIQNVAILEESFLQFPKIHGDFQANLLERSLNFSSAIYSGKSNPISIRAELPITISSEPLMVHVDKKSPVELHVATEFEIAPILQLLLTDTVTFAGKTKAALDIRGKWNEPTVSGFAEIKEGSYEDLDTGAVFHDLYARFEGNEKELILKSLKANNGENGSVSASGFLKIDWQNHFPFNITMDIQHAHLIHLDYARASASGKLNLSGNMKKRKLSGELFLEKATIAIPEEIPSQLKTIDFTYVNLPPVEKLKPTLKKKKKKETTTLDVALQVPKNAFVKGRDLKSEWKGSVYFSGTNTQPLIEGSLQLISGEFLFNGRSFTSNKGTVTFSGQPEKTSLYVVAERQIEDIRVETILKGPIQDPEFSFRSNPPLSKKEILSWILFDRGLDEITPIQGSQLSHTVFTLSGGQDNSDLLSKIRNSIGIDRIDISSKDTGETNEVSVRVGKYISRGVFVSLYKSINGEANQVAIEANLSKRFKVKGEIGDNQEGKMSIKWSRDY